MSYLHEEVRRLLKVLPQTDPTTHEYHTLLQSLECITNAQWLEDAAAVVLGEVCHDTVLCTAQEEVEQETVTPADTTESGTVQTAEVTESTEVEAPVTKDPDYDIPDEPVQPDPVEEKPAKTYTKVEVRAALVAYRNGGGNIKEFLAHFGADNFSTLDESQWSAVMEALNA